MATVSGRFSRGGVNVMTTFPVEEKIIAAQPGWETKDNIPIIAWLIGIDSSVYPITVHGVIRERPVTLWAHGNGWVTIGERDS